MRTVGVWGLLVLAGVARADDKPVELATSVPTIIAVSSTVDNAAIKPEHIADGKLETAWNSRTGDLTPHVFVRVPAGSKVTSIKLTAGFTKIDKKLGDLFTMNPRIKKVRVSSGGKSVEHDLDVSKRELQELAIDLPAGDLDIAVLASEPGTKKNWREISISELQVWGTTTAPIKKQKPAIRLGTLDSLPVLTDAECKKIVGKLEGKYESDEQIAISADYTICRIDSTIREGLTKVTFAAASRTQKKLLGKPVTHTIANGKQEGELAGGAATYQFEGTGSLSVELIPLRTTEMALQVYEESTERTDDGMGSGAETTTLYRVDASGIVQLVSWSSSRSGSDDTNDGSDCTGPTWKVTANMPKKLEVRCVDWSDDVVNGGGRRKTKQDRTVWWDGTKYK